MVGGVETPCHTRLPSLNYAGSNVQPSVITHSLSGGKEVYTHQQSSTRTLITSHDDRLWENTVASQLVDFLLLVGCL
jgi:hypothetical protein